MSLYIVKYIIIRFSIPTLHGKTLDKPTDKPNALNTLVSYLDFGQTFHGAASILHGIMSWDVKKLRLTFIML